LEEAAAQEQEHGEEEEEEKYVQIVMRGLCATMRGVRLHDSVFGGVAVVWGWVYRLMSLDSYFVVVVVDAWG